MELWVIKLGGSIITEKQAGIPAIRAGLVSQLCEKIATFVEAHKDIRIALLHGAGSVGHPLAKEYNLVDMPLDAKRVFGMAKTVTAMRALSNSICSALQDCAVPAIPMQTSSMFYRGADGRLVFASQEIVAHLFDAKGLPVMCGDVVSTKNNTSSIASADEIAVSIAQVLPVTRMLFATDVDGVYETFPPASSETHVQNITRDDIRRFIDEADMPHNEQDVTGGMKGKLSALLPLKAVEVSIFNGLDPENLDLALRRKQVGTRIQL